MRYKKDVAAESILEPSLTVTPPFVQHVFVNEYTFPNKCMHKRRLACSTKSASIQKVVLTIQKIIILEFNARSLDEAHRSQRCLLAPKPLRSF